MIAIRRKPDTAIEANPEAREALTAWRAAFAELDWEALREAPVYRGDGVPRGDGSPVVVVPGILAADRDLAELHAWLARMNYRPHASCVGGDACCPEELTARLSDTVRRVAAESGHRVRVIGHGLGGLLARGAAIRTAGRVSQVITLGSPVHGVRSHPALLAAVEVARGCCGGACLEPLQQEMPWFVAEANVYSRDDNVVDWQTCARHDGTRCVEVHGRHPELVCNPEVYAAIGRLLAEPVAAGRHVCRPRFVPVARQHAMAA
jgi:pimeloyl-ACP methyl ester carboxylesterase